MEAIPHSLNKVPSRQKGQINIKLAPGFKVGERIYWSENKQKWDDKRKGENAKLISVSTDHQGVVTGVIENASSYGVYRVKEG